jgi:hypothetical protein
MSVLTRSSGGDRIRVGLCAAAIFLGGIGSLMAGDQLLLESRTLSREGTDTAVVLPSGPVVLSSKVIASCVPGSRNDDDVLSFELETGVCQFIPSAERKASKMMQRPSFDISWTDPAIPILECLISHRGVLIREASRNAICFGWYQCDDLTPFIIGQHQVCAGSFLVLDAGPGYASYLWAPGGETTQQINVTPVATTHYSVTVTDGAGCAVTSAEHLVEVILCAPEIFADDFETGNTGRWSHTAN